MNIQALFVVFLSCFLTAQACSPGWLQYGNSCYLFGNISVDFLTAQDYCLDSFGCNLVHINDASENNFIKTTVQALNARAWWIGLTDMDNEGVFQWIDDYKNVTFTDWYPGQPNDYKTGEDCVDLFVNYNFAWSDYDCLKKASNPICEKAPMTGFKSRAHEARETNHNVCGNLYCYAVSGKYNVTFPQTYSRGKKLVFK